MKQKSFFILSVVISLIFFNGCAPLYIPNVVNTPLLSNKGEVQATIHGGVAGFDPQLAYAVTDNIGLMLNGSFQNTKSDTTDDFHKHQFVELGAGYYKKISKIGRFEVFGGFGLGKLKTKADHNIFDKESDVKSNRIFIQPAVGLTTKVVDLGFASRFVLVNLKQGSDKYTRSFWEPALTARAGFKNVKAVIQMGFSMPFDSDNLISYQPFIFSMGLHINLNKKYE